MFSAVALTLITFALTHRDKGAWSTALVALEANGVLLAGWTTYHWLRLPYIIRRELLEQIPKKEGETVPQGELNQTVDSLIRIFTANIDVKATRVFSTYVGKTLQVKGKVQDVVDLTDKTTMLILKVGEHLVSVKFTSEWRDSLVSLRKSDIVNAKGIISSGNAISLTLTQGELLE